MNRPILVLVGILPAILGAGCSKDPPESDTAPSASEEKKTLSTKAKGRLDCDVVWPIFEQDDKLLEAFGAGARTLAETKPRTKAIDDLAAAWAAGADTVRSDDLRKQGTAIITLLKQRQTIYQKAIERAERGDPIPAPPKDETKVEKKPSRPLTEREKALQEAAEVGMKGLLGEGAGESIFSGEEQTLLKLNHREIRNVRSKVFDFCMNVDYEPRRGNQ